MNLKRMICLMLLQITSIIACLALPLDLAHGAFADTEIQVAETKADDRNIIIGSQAVYAELESPLCTTLRIGHTEGHLEVCSSQVDTNWSLYSNYNGLPVDYTHGVSRITINSDNTYSSSGAHLNKHPLSGIRISPESVYYWELLTNLEELHVDNDIGKPFGTESNIGIGNDYGASKDTINSDNVYSSFGTHPNDHSLSGTRINPDSVYYWELLTNLEELHVDNGIEKPFRMGVCNIDIGNDYGASRVTINSDNAYSSFGVYLNDHQLIRTRISPESVYYWELLTNLEELHVDNGIEKPFRTGVCNIDIGNNHGASKVTINSDNVYSSFTTHLNNQPPTGTRISPESVCYWDLLTNLEGLHVDNDIGKPFGTESNIGIGNDYGASRVTINSDNVYSSFTTHLNNQPLSGTRISPESVCYWDLLTNLEELHANNVIGKPFRTEVAEMRGMNMA